MMHWEVILDGDDATARIFDSLRMAYAFVRDYANYDIYEGVYERKLGAPDAHWVRGRRISSVRGPVT